MRPSGDDPAMPGRGHGSRVDGASDDAALARRLRDDADAARRLSGLRRAAYGRAGSAAPLAPVPAGLRAATGIEDPVLPTPLLELLGEEARLVAEGRALLDREAGDAAAALRREIHGSEGRGSAEHADARAGTDTDADTDRDADTRRPRPPRLVRPGVLVAAVAAALVVGGFVGASASGLRDHADPGAGATASPDGSRGSRVEAMGTPNGRRASALPPFTASPPPHVSATDAEVAEAYRREADASWEMFSAGIPGAVRPDVSLERVMSEEDFPAQQVECLTSEGVEASVVGGGGITYEDGDPVKVWACQARFPMQQPDPRTDAELAYQHDYIVSFLLPCYAVEGSPYTDAVPGREEYVARAKAGDPWFPFPDDIDGALSSRCPAQPPAWG
jgi:hypothetical protein